MTTEFHHAAADHHGTADCDSSPGCANRDAAAAGITAIARLEDGEEFLAFLYGRLCEEVLAATYRRATGSGPAAEVAERGLRMLDELVLDIRRGQGIDPSSLRLLAHAYREHPQFRSHWAASLVAVRPDPSQN